ncbi:MAG: nucleoside phosphorylase [Candidatus Geothermarchaeales archaeon]
MSLRGSDVVIEPKEFVNYLKNIKRIERVDVKKTCICCYDSRILSKIVDRTRAEKVENWVFWGEKRRTLLNFEVNGDEASVFRFEFGAPNAGTMLEILIACGARCFIVFGSAGTLQRHVDTGDLVIARQAVVDEGLSRHYSESMERLEGGERVIDALEAACRKKGAKYHVGTTLSTDAIFRETVEKVGRHQMGGVLTVDMEASALYAISRFRGVETACLFYVSDSLADLRWKPRFHDSAVERSIDVGVDIVLDAAQTLGKLVK